MSLSVSLLILFLKLNNFYLISGTSTRCEGTCSKGYTVAANAMLKQFSEVFSNGIIKDMVLDASNVRLREVTLNYNLPSKFLKKSVFQSASVSLYGRNLFFLYNAAGDIDPESSYTSNPTGAALEHSGLPSTRSMGVNLKVGF